MFFFRATKILLIFSLVLWNFSSCKPKESNDSKPQQGTLHISVDESFKPIIDQQIMVFESSFPKAHIQVEYKSEADCFRDFQSDSTHMIIVARAPKKEENDYYKRVLGHPLLYSVIAFDADALIVNAAAQDSIFTIKTLNKILTDSVSGKYQVLLDGDNATSTVRFLMDSITNGKPFGINVKGTKGNEEVLQQVADNQNAIGFVGSSWVINADIENKYKGKVKLAFVECKRCNDGTFAKPSQSTIYNVQYPLVRPLYCILKNADVGLGASFYNFMSFERGQLIFRTGDLVPAKMNFTIRKMVNKPNQVDSSK
ncbi:MAG TPA: substrate-binding domain-containing protein [Arachidicoccus sp.]|nr:substrate-binding domain-containing protein [Arachidicoccus sp.]